jgi:molecular chaperone HscB
MDPFATLGAPRRFDLDLGALEKSHRELSRALHPDRFAHAAPSERRAALERAADVNAAWRILRDPIQRAESLFALAGFKVGETHEPKASPMFLMQVMEEREALADARQARDLSKVRKLAEAALVRKHAAEAKLGRGFSEAVTSSDELSRLLPILGELRFLRRFLEEIEAIEDEALEAAGVDGGVR